MASLTKHVALMVLYPFLLPDVARNAQEEHDAFLVFILAKVKAADNAESVALVDS